MMVSGQQIIGTTPLTFRAFPDDETNIHRHARRNAQDAIALARRKAQDFDTQAALERKTNEALKLAKGQAHVRDDTEETSGESSTPLVDRKDCNYLYCACL